jgi:hypothetical protein
MGDRAKGDNRCQLGETASLESWRPLPVFSVSVASKGFSPTVSLLFATFTREGISVASKELKEEEQGRNEVTR